MSEMHNPSHSGLTLRDDVLPALGLPGRPLMIFGRHARS
jgi:hypothetical protein